MAEAVEYYFVALRLTHFLAGIMWIGLLYYFNFVQIPSFKELDAPVRQALIPKLVKRAVFWFRWSAVVTVLVGWLYFFSRFALDGYPNPAGNVWWYYSIMAGGLLGTFMLINVWGIIWRYQKRVIAATEGALAGKPAPPEMALWGKKAVTASRFNLVMSVPLLFFMATASHLALF
jgi:uncharacterized membrane protein